MRHPKPLGVIRKGRAVPLWHGFCLLNYPGGRPDFQCLWSSSCRTHGEALVSLQSHLQRKHPYTYRAAKANATHAH